MSLAAINASPLGNALALMFSQAEIIPGDAPSYQLCKTLMAYHPLGAKMTDSPIALAQSQRRRITVQKGPEERLAEAFEAEWDAIDADKHIFNMARLSRGYGIASIAMLSEGTPPGRPLSYKDLWQQDIGFNILDPLNTAGSLVLNQNPNSIDFQKVVGISVGGVPYHRSRAVTIQNENPLYIEWTPSAFGFTGRSVFQRALYPMRSFIRSMVTDDLVLLKAGVIVAKMKPPGSIVDRAMQIMVGAKRALVQQAVAGNVLGITPDEDIETLNFQNLEGPTTMARKNALDNIATAADMPAVLLNQETFAEGFGEGTEDAKRVSQYINRVRVWLWPVYHWMDRIVMARAWNPKFYEALQREFPAEYGQKGYTQAYYEWTNSFTATWPNLIEEPDSEKIKVDDVKFKAVVAAAQVLAPMVDPPNRARLVLWVQDCFNERKELFPAKLQLDMESLDTWLEEQAEQQDAMQQAALAGGDEGGPQEPKPAAPFSARDSESIKDAMDRFSGAVEALARREPVRRAA